MNVITTVVGSYPTQSFKPTSINDKINNCLGLYDPYKNAIKESVTSMTNAGIDIISDGQVRGDMIKIFANKINGLEIVDNSVYIKGKIIPAAHPMSINDFKLAYKIASSIDNKFKLHASLDKIFQHEQKGIKGIITGPTTMVHSMSIDKFYSSKTNAIPDMAVALKREAIELEKAGACAIQIDEPFISIGVEDINISQNAVELISEAVDIPVALHVCGNLSEVMSKLFKFKVDILDFEFAGMPENISVLKNSWNDNINKLIAIGCIDTKKETVDHYNKVKNITDQVNEIINNDNCIIDPDCGMRMLSKEAAYKKLEILNKIESGV